MAWYTKQHKGKIKLKAQKHIKKIHTDHFLPALLSIQKREREREREGGGGGVTLHNTGL